MSRARGWCAAGSCGGVAPYRAVTCAMDGRSLVETLFPLPPPVSLPLLKRIGESGAAVLRGDSTRAVEVQRKKERGKEDAALLAFSPVASALQHMIWADFIDTFITAYLGRVEKLNLM